MQNGFRAPSLQQQFFRTQSTNFINGVPFDIVTFPVSDPVAIALGAKPLEPEESLNYSLGAVMRFGRLTLTVDAYHIQIDDRIVLSENLTQANVRAYLTSLGSSAQVAAASSSMAWIPRPKAWTSWRTTRCRWRRRAGSTSLPRQTSTRRTSLACLPPRR